MCLPWKKNSPGERPIDNTCGGHIQNYSTQIHLSLSSDFQLHVMERMSVHPVGGEKK